MMVRNCERARQWLSFEYLVPYVSGLWFNMFTASLFDFVSQLHLLPEAYVGECKETAKELALHFMHGPRFWLHGHEGPAFAQIYSSIR